MPYGWDESHEAYQRVYNEGQPHEAKLSHELIAGGAAFAAFKALEDHQRKEGKTVNHAFAKELLIGFAGAEVDKLVETKGADHWDREKAKHEAKKNAEHMYDEQYERHEVYDPYHKHHERYEQQFNR